MFSTFRKLALSSTLIGLLLALIMIAPAAAQQAADTGPTVDPCAAVRAANANDNNDHEQMMADNGMSTTDGQSAVSGPPCPGTGATNAGPPLDTWLALDPGATHWYKFRYVYDPERDDEPRNAVAILDMRQAGCIAFDVYTRDMLEFPLDDEGEVRGPVGRGTAFDAGDEDDDKDRTQLNWVGSSTSSETYFIIVRNRSDNVCSYYLSLSGASVRYN